MSDVKLRIDTRYFRFCIHRQALKAIGSPTFLTFGYHPEEQRLMVVGTWADNKQSVRIRFDSCGSVYIYSKPLIQGIRQVSHILMATGSYLVSGEARASDHILIFSLREAEIISED